MNESTILPDSEDKVRFWLLWLLTVKKERSAGSPMVECMLGIYEALGSIDSTKRKKQEDRNVCFAELKLRSDSVTPWDAIVGNSLVWVQRGPQTGAQHRTHRYTSVIVSRHPRDQDLLSTNNTHMVLVPGPCDPRGRRCQKL